MRDPTSYGTPASHPRSLSLCLLILGLWERGLLLTIPSHISRAFCSLNLPLRVSLSLLPPYLVVVPISARAASILQILSARVLSLLRKTWPLLSVLVLQKAV
jgi:hypothetical protein